VADRRRVQDRQRRPASGQGESRIAAEAAAGRGLGIQRHQQDGQRRQQDQTGADPGQGGRVAEQAVRLIGQSQPRGHEADPAGSSDDERSRPAVAQLGADGRLVAAQQGAAQRQGCVQQLRIGEGDAVIPLQYLAAGFRLQRERQQHRQRDQHGRQPDPARLQAGQPRPPSARQQIRAAHASRPSRGRKDRRIGVPVKLYSRRIWFSR